MTLYEELQARGLIAQVTDEALISDLINNGSGYIYSIEDYRSIISERAKDGWRYVGCIPTKQRGTGHIQEMDLIFEKEL